MPRHIHVFGRSPQILERKIWKRVAADAALIWCAALVTACASLEPKPRGYDAAVIVESDPGTPVPGAEIVREGGALGRTDAAGRVIIHLDGLEGESFAVAVRCPDEYTSPPAPMQVLLRRNQDPRRLPVYRATCSPKTRAVVVAVRAENGPNLPVLHLGKEIARTDDSGVAHAALRLRPGERIELTLGTGENPRVVPHDPSAVFVGSDRDELFFFDQAFKPVAVRRSAPQRPKPLR